jgi:fumarylacetoacetate (FAA) hydrolase
VKLASYIERPIQPGLPDIKLGALFDDCVIDLPVAQTWAQGARGFRARDLPATMMDLLRDWEDGSEHLHNLLAHLPEDGCTDLRGTGRRPVARPREDVILLPPLPNVLSLRDFMGFEKHVRNTQRLRSKAIPRVWYEIPVFYYGNPFTILGPDQGVEMPGSGAALDYELEIACVIAHHGRDIPAEEAADYIAGYMVMNDWSLRDVQVQEMGAGLGPAKGKDFATSLGPALVTPDELADRLVNEGAEARYDLMMTALVNGVERSRGNFAEIHWTFAQMIERASQDVSLFPGEVFGSGTVGSGSLFEQGAEDDGSWLKPGDTVTLEVERLGILESQVLSPIEASS